MTHRIKNFDALNTSALRSDALAIAEAAYAAIDTNAAIRSHLSVNGTTLSAGGRDYELSKFKRIRVMGFGKASCAAAQTIEALLRSHITEGIVIDVSPGTCEIIDVVQGTHPRPSSGNVALTERLVGMAKDSREDDLVLVAVSGGGSSLLCYPLEECDQSTRLYDDLLRTGATIEEMNTIRKHLSSVKGGGLAKLLYPAQVIGLIFCDIPGDGYQDVASGPTFFDPTTIADAQRILDKYGLTEYRLNETPKDQKLFERVNNVPVLSNTVALTAMEKAARERGYDVKNIGNALYDAPARLVDKLLAAAKPKTAVLGGGEASLTVTKSGSKGGRCQYVALAALQKITQDDIVLALASDGIDNSDAAGAIADAGVLKCVSEKGLSIEDRLADYDTYEFFKTCGALPFTGSTDANVSDLYLLLRG